MYSVDRPEDLPANVQKMPHDIQEQWCEVFNSVLKACDGEDKKECEKMAFERANGVAKKRMEEEKKSVPESKMAEMPYVPYGVLTLADALAAQDAQKQNDGLHALISMYEQVRGNIFAAPDVADKKAALATLTAELMGHLRTEAVDDEMKAAHKREGGKAYSASCYLVTEDASKPSTWHLRVKDEDGTVNHRLMGAAWAALHGGYRGNRYEGPQKAEALRKLKALYKKEGLETPGDGKSVAVSDDYDPSLVKALGDNRFGGYAVLWGSPDRRDLTGEYFDHETGDLDAIFKAVGALPYFYHHALDGAIKTRVIGKVDVLESDDVGMWYEAQLQLADDYDRMVAKLIREGKMKSSSQTLASGRKVAASGRILRWPIVEISATPAPAEPRMLPVSEIKSGYECIGCDFEQAVKTLEAEGAPDPQGDEKLRWLARLEAEQTRTALLEL